MVTATHWKLWNCGTLASSRKTSLFIRRPNHSLASKTRGLSNSATCTDYSRPCHHSPAASSSAVTRDTIMSVCWVFSLVTLLILTPPFIHPPWASWAPLPHSGPCFFIPTFLKPSPHFGSVEPSGFSTPTLEPLSRHNRGAPGSGTTITTGVIRDVGCPASGAPSANGWQLGALPRSPIPPLLYRGHMNWCHAPQAAQPTATPVRDILPPTSKKKPNTQTCTMGLLLILHCINITIKEL